MYVYTVLLYSSLQACAVVTGKRDAPSNCRECCIKENLKIAGKTYIAQTRTLNEPCGQKCLFHSFFPKITSRSVRIVTCNKLWAGPTAANIECIRLVNMSESDFDVSIAHHICLCAMSHQPPLLGRRWANKLLGLLLRSNSQNRYL